MLAPAAHLDRLYRAANQPHVPRSSPQASRSPSPRALDRLDADARFAALAQQNRPKDRRESWGGRWHVDLRLIATTAVVQATATTPCTTAARASRRSASGMVARSPTAATAASSMLIAPVFRERQLLRDRARLRHRGHRARVGHAIARLKNRRVLQDHRRRSRQLANTLQAVAFLHNLHLDDLRTIVSLGGTGAIAPARRVK